MNNSKKISEDLVAIINNAVGSRIYGSVEIYFEDGKVTQVTQRIIRKISHKDEKKANSLKSQTAISLTSSVKEL